MWANLPQKTLDLLVPPHKREWEGKKCPLPHLPHPSEAGKERQWYLVLQRWASPLVPLAGTLDGQGLWEGVCSLPSLGMDCKTSRERQKGS